jgi:hypothetical protein
MKFYNTRKSFGGDYWTTEWSASEMANLNVVVLVIVSTLLAVLSTIASAILVLVTINDFEEEGFVPSIYGALISLVFLLDVHYRFIIRVILYVIFGEEWIEIFFNLNMGYFFAHIFLIFFGHLTYRNIETENKKMVLFTICLFISVLTYFITDFVYVYVPY